MLNLVPIWGQIPPQPIVTTTSACLNECLEQGSAVFAAANLRNFQKIILNVEEFCNTHEKLLRCAQSCSDEERTKLDEKINLSTYICTDKLEDLIKEFRLVRECMEGQEDDDINGCANECGHPSDATVQLDSSPAAPVNPFSFIDSITPVCRTIECVMKCSIKHLNKRCPGSGYLFRDIGYKQVLEASRRLHNEASNSSPLSPSSSSTSSSSLTESSSSSSSLSSSTSSSLSSSITEQLAKTYLESLPEPCSYIINTLNYNMTFPQDETSDESGMITEAVDVVESTVKTSSNSDESVEQTTSKMVNVDDAHLITSLFTTQSAKMSSDEATDKEEMEEEMTMSSDSSVTMEMINKPDSELESSLTQLIDRFHPHITVARLQSVPSHTDVEHIMESEIKGIISSAMATSTEIVQAGNTEEEKDMKSESQEEERKEDEGHEHHEDEEKEEDEMRIGTTVSSSQMETIPTIVVEKSNEHDEEVESKEKTSDDDLQQFSTPGLAQETTERTIIVVNDDDMDQEIDTNTIQHRDHTVAEQQKNGMIRKSQICLLFEEILRKRLWVV
uniref:Chondroitin proteoglycan 4 domain-containing protein n=1 Tax=Setaria digitata TaxID=48799 RepID=A0A915PIH3_9BILA